MTGAPKAAQSPGKRRSTRMAVALLLVAVAVVFSAYAGYSWWSYSRITSVESMQLNDASRGAIDLRVEQSRTLYQVALVFVAALWALLIAKKDETRISFADTPEVTMFIIASGLLLTSIVWHQLFVSQVAEAFRDSASTFVDGGRVPDVFRPMYNHMFVFQWWFLVVGACATVVTLISAHHMRTN